MDKEELKEPNPEELLKEMVDNIKKIESDYQKQLGRKDVEIFLLKEQLGELGKNSPELEIEMKKLANELVAKSLNFSSLNSQGKINQSEKEKTSLKDTLDNKIKEHLSQKKQIEDTHKKILKTKDDNIKSLQTTITEKDKKIKELITQITDALNEEENEE